MTVTESLLMVLDNDRTAYDAIWTMAEDCHANRDQLAAESLGVFNADQAETYHLADRIKDYVETLCDDPSAGLTDPASLVVSQLFRHALDLVEWSEVADHYLAKLAEA